MFDFKKNEKKLYQPGPEPSLIDVGPMGYLTIQGQGDPNTSEVYQTAVEMLYGLAYTIKMSKKGDVQAPGYFDFVVPPLEGIWSMGGQASEGPINDQKQDFSWTMMLRMPDFVDEAALDTAKAYFQKKKPDMDLSLVKLTKFTEGLCAQVLHIGSYAEAESTILKLEEFIKNKGFQAVMKGLYQHHEIYLGDPRKTEPDKLKTIIRRPIKKLKK
ncbi:MAG: GyrI-like domain-containing protein [Clostridiaceae bacterium]